MRTVIIATSVAAALFSSPAFTQHPTKGTATIPDFSGVWAHPSAQSGFEPLPSGPRPVTGMLRRDGVSDPYQYVGDYTNPILKPEAAEVVKRFGEIELSGLSQHHTMALHAQARQLARHGQIRTRRACVAVSGSPHRRQAQRMAGPPQPAPRQGQLAIQNRRRPRQAEEIVPSVRVTRATLIQRVRRFGFLLSIGGKLISATAKNLATIEWRKSIARRQLPI